MTTRHNRELRDPHALPIERRRGALLIHLRKELGLQQPDLAAALNQSTRTIRRFEKEGAPGWIPLAVLGILVDVGRVDLWSPLLERAGLPARLPLPLAFRTLSRRI